MSVERSKAKYVGRVLVVDDNWITLKLMEKMLEGLGVVPVTLDSGAAALDLLKADHFDILFLDCSMPDIHGQDVAKQIRESEKAGSRLRVIAFTGDDSIENRRLCKEAGMDGLFAKPYSFTALEDLLKKFLKTQ